MVTNPWRPDDKQADWAKKMLGMQAEQTRGMSIDAGGRSRSSILTTLFDGKLYTPASNLFFQSVGTGSTAVSDGKCLITAGSGQYEIFMGNRLAAYLPHDGRFSAPVECH
jgi:hypothetical protein